MQTRPRIKWAPSKCALVQKWGESVERRGVGESQNSEFKLELGDWNGEDRGNQTHNAHPAEGRSFLFHSSRAQEMVISFVTEIPECDKIEQFQLCRNAGGNGCAATIFADNFVRTWAHLARPLLTKVKNSSPFRLICLTSLLSVRHFSI